MTNVSILFHTVRRTWLKTYIKNECTWCPDMKWSWSLCSESAGLENTIGLRYFTVLVSWAQQQLLLKDWGLLPDGIAQVGRGLYILLLFQRTQTEDRYLAELDLLKGGFIVFKGHLFIIPSWLLVLLLHFHQERCKVHNFFIEMYMVWFRLYSIKRVRIDRICVLNILPT